MADDEIIVYYETYVIAHAVVVRVVDRAGLVPVVVASVVGLGHAGWRRAPGGLQALRVRPGHPRRRLASLDLRQHRFQLFLNFYRNGWT